MIRKIPILELLLLLVFSMLSACGGVFEVDIEATPGPGAAVTAGTTIPQATQTLAPVEPTSSPALDDDAAIQAALAEKLGIPVEQSDMHITQNTGTHATGSVFNGYFLAVKQAGGWTIIYDGQATPYCQEIEAYGFPTSMVLECLDENNNLIVRGETQSVESLQSLSCLDAVSGSAESVACNIQDGLRSRNISALRSYMADPFFIAYWRSEGISETPDAILSMLPDLYNFNDPDYIPRLTFTTDRSKFPQAVAQAPERLVSPELNIALVVYSQGWGQDGQGEALIYIAQDASGKPYWPGMLYSLMPFDN